MRASALFKHWSRRLLAPDQALRRTFEAFKTLLVHDLKSHELMAEFEELLHDGGLEDFARTRRRGGRLAEAVGGMVSQLAQMHPGQAGDLGEYFKKYEFYLRLRLEPPERFLIPPFAVGHDELIEAAQIGAKSHNLLRLRLEGKVKVPPGFTITANTFAVLVEHNHLRPALDLLLAGIDTASEASLRETSLALMTLVRRMEFPDAVAEAILAQYDRLAAGGPAPLVAVRSSGLHEDGEHSFAGQYHSVLGAARQTLLTSYLEVVASKYTPEALLYRIHAGLSDEEAAMAVLVLAMVDAAASGVVYTQDPTAGPGRLLVQSIAGLGLPLVGGEVSPDVYAFAGDSNQPVEVIAGSQRQQLVLRHGLVREEDCEPAANRPLSLAVDQAAQLAAIGRELENLFGGPQDIEWALDSDGELLLLQCRPLRQEIAPLSPPEAADFHPSGEPLLSGARRASGTLCAGIVHHYDPLAPEAIPQGAVLVTGLIPPSLVRHIDRFAGVVCERGAVTGHFATVCREFGRVLLVEAAQALRLLPQGAAVIVDARTGSVYAGRLPDWQQPPAAVDRPFTRRLRDLLTLVTPLRLTDPEDEGFRPHNCRSLHDIIRYAHEQAMRAMFGLGGQAAGASSRSRKLAAGLPLDIYLLDLGGGIAEAAGAGEEVAPEQVTSRPCLAIWRGLSHPEVDWQSHLHFDWKGFSDVALSGGLASGGAREYASFALISGEYCNLNMRFGYHFTLVDCLAGQEGRANHCRLRFAGGGGDDRGRALRLLLLQAILGRLGFEATIRADLLDARLEAMAADEMDTLLADVGRLLGATKLLDLTLQDEDDVAPLVAQFFRGAGRFIRPDRSGEAGSADISAEEG